MLPQLILIVFCFSQVYASPHARVKRQASQLLPTYDFIIAGGGTTGLTVADRLTGAFPEKSVLVIEYGDVGYVGGHFDPPSVTWTETGDKAICFTFESLPNPAIKDRTAWVLAGKAIGGSSTINGMYFDRGSRFDYDAWASVSSPEFDSSENKWDFDGMFPYFKKSVTFTDPDIETVAKYGYTWDNAAYGGTTPIFATFPTFQWADFFIVRDAWKEMGIPEAKDCAGGDKEGICWVPNSQDPWTARRSHAGLGHLALLNGTRPNYHVLIEHQVTRVITAGNFTASPPYVEVRSLSGGNLFNLTAKAEVILAAGAFHTPTILQRSGIGSSSVLSAAGIPLVLDLPGVGANFQDHLGPNLSWNYSSPGDFYPLPADMIDPVFVAKATAEFDMRPAQGPYTLALENSAIYLALPNITSEYAQLIDKIRRLNDNGSSSAYLPADYNADPTLIAGYKRQLSVLADFLENPRAPCIEARFATGTSMGAVHLHPLSRGTVRLNLTDHLSQAVVDFRVGSHPIDLQISIAQIRFLRKVLDTETMQRYGAYALNPDQSIQTDDAMLEYVKDTMRLSDMHPCCTAAMLPKELGGVVGPDLKVYGTSGLRIVDMSILPFLTSSHLSATAYAVGEKAADIIIRQWQLE